MLEAPAAPEKESGTPAKLGSTTVTVSLSSLIIFCANLIPNPTLREFAKIASPLIGLGISRGLRLLVKYIIYERGNWKLRKYIRLDKAELATAGLSLKRARELNDSLADYQSRLRQRRIDNL